MNNQQGQMLFMGVIVIGIVAIAGLGWWFRFNSVTNEAHYVAESNMIQGNADVHTDDLMVDNAFSDDTVTMDQGVKDSEVAVAVMTAEETLGVPGLYIDYSTAVYQAANDHKRVLFFHATWCPTCIAANRAFQNNLDQIPSDVVVLKTDYDTETALKEKYGITYQHTFVQVDEQGKVVAIWNGGDVDTLIKNIK